MRASWAFVTLFAQSIFRRSDFIFPTLTTRLFKGVNNSKVATGFALSFFLFLPVVFAFGTAQAAAPMMVVPGQPSVSAAGTFSYSIPIAVPPGTAGMVPALSLDYSSAQTDGFEGWGFSLDGLASITRCARTITLDSVHGSVNYDMNDRFCLNGQRLMVVSGTYGADGSTYRTYIDSFSKIIAHGAAGNGPAWFEVHTKSGTVLQLGNTADSAIQAVGKTTNREWLVNQVTDTKGNYYKVTYTDDQTNGQAYPTRIDYTGNASASLATYNSVQFTYAARNDIVPTYQAGSLQQVTVVLTDIKTYAGATLVFDYKLAYRAGTSTLHSRLTSVTQCDSSGTTCLAPTTFGWQGGVALTTMTGTANSTAQNLGLMAGDFNADGLTDALVLDSSCPAGGVIFSGSNTGTFARANMTANYTYWLTGPPPSEVPYNGPACFKGTPMIGDLNGDGFADVMQNLSYYITGTDPRWSQFVGPLLNTKTGALNQQGVVDTTIPRMIILGDFNGDGRIDGYGAAPNRQFYYSNGDGTFTTGGTTGLSGTLFGGDFDGDGCEDLMQQGSPNQLYYGCYPAVATATVPDLTNKTVIVGDFNGDLSTDVLVVDSTGAANAVLYLATGTGLDAGHTISSSTSWHNYQIVEGDWNGDGKADIALISSTTSAHLIFLSTGTGFTQVATIASTATATSAVAADWNNDGATDLWIQKAAGDYVYNPTFGSSAYAPERVITVSNGIGATTTVAYDRLNKNGTFFTKSTGAAYPYQDADGPNYVVSSYSLSNGIGGTYTTTYKYAGMRTNVTDPPKQNTLPTGFLSFSSVTSTDSQTGIVTTTNYRTDIPYVGLIASQTVKSGSVTLNSITNTWNAASETGGAYIMTLTQSVLAQNDLDGTAMPGVTTSYPSYDGYGNPLTITQTVTDGSSQTTTNTYTNDTTNWILGQLLTSNVERKVGSSDLTRHFQFVHDPASGLVTQHIVEPGANDNTYLKSVYGRDAFGNQTSVTTSAYNTSFGATRTSSVVYDNKGQFVVTATDALSHSQTWGTAAAPAYDARFGVPTSHTGLNGEVTSWSYDTFGRMTLETRPDGNKTAWTYTLWTSTYFPNVEFYAEAIPRASNGTTQNGPATVSYYDGLSREVVGGVQGFSGAWTIAYTQYDSWGRVGQQSRPYFYTANVMQPQSIAKFTVYTYDILARVTKATFPDTSDTTTAYHGLSSTVTNDKGQATTTVLNAQGLAASVTDANSKTTSYVYDAFGDLTSVTDPLSNVVTGLFDIRGRKTRSVDPDMGTWNYGYDAFSDLTSQSDAKSQNTTLVYDLLERPTQRVESGLTSNWVYDTAAHGIGSLASACTGTGCTTPANSIHFRSQTYDSLGRPSGTALTMGGTTVNYTTTYNTDGRVDTVTRPSGFVSKNVYQATYGYLSQIQDNGTSAVIWTNNARDAELHLTQGTFGNNVVENQSFDANTGLVSTIQAGTSNSVANYAYGWDTIGNLTSRQDVIEGYTERFCYDPLNRLTNYAIGTSCTASGTKTVAYDAIGNVSSKTGVGTYGYPASGSASVRPHAVTSITGTVNGVANPTYAYDANGNMTSGGGRTITPTSFNMAGSVVQGTVADCISYDSEHNRYEMDTRASSCTGALSASTFYLNDLVSGSMEEASIPLGGSVTWQDYISTDNGLVAVRACTGGTTAPCTGSATYAYVVSDHLGSTSVLANASGTVTERDSYDAWGRRRNANGTDASASCTGISSATTHGFTSQEHLDPVCAINLNARLYDPTVGRFLSTDSMVPNPLNGQSYNGFSYLTNNPLNATDPTGHDGEQDKLKESSTCPAGGANCGENHPQNPAPIQQVVVTGERIPPSTGAYNTGSRGGSGSGSGGGGVEEVVVTAERQKQKTTVSLTPPRLPDFNLPKLPDDTNDGKCHPGAVYLGNLLRSTAHTLNQASAIGLARGAYAVVAAAPGIPETAFTSEVPGAVLIGGSIVGFDTANALNDLGLALQAYGTSNSSEAVSAAQQEQFENETSSQVPGADTYFSVKSGLEDAKSAPPQPVHC